MIERILLPAALLALAGAPVKAQTFPDPAAAGANLGGTAGGAGAGGIGATGGIGTGTTQPFFIGGTPFNFVPGLGFFPQGATNLGNGFVFGDPFAFNNGFGVNSGFVNGLNNGFNNGFGTSFTPGFGGGFGFSPFFYGQTGPYSTNLPYLQTNTGMRLPAGAVPPIWNAAVAANRARAAARGTSSRRQARARTASPRIPTEVAVAPGTRFDREMVAGSRQESTSSAPTMTKAEKEDEMRASYRIDTLMRDRPITEGELIRLGASGAQVRITTNGEVRTERYPMENVFFFGDDGRLATALQAPDEVTPGARVLVPVPTSEPDMTITPVMGSIVTERVAGSRQTATKKATTKKAAKKTVKAKKRK